jgi:hypothetical protein
MRSASTEFAGTPSRRRRLLPWIVGTVVWFAAVGAGFVILVDFGRTPGAAANAPHTWPTQSALQPASDRHTLVTFVHPHCSCSRASLRELARLVERLRGRVSPIVVILALDGVETDRTSRELRALAASVDGVTVVDDPGGHEADRFGGTTSGYTTLYDEAGTLQFAGGLTASRGQEGDSFGRARIIELIEAGRTDRQESPVFGCPLDSFDAVTNEQMEGKES